MATHETLLALQEAYKKHIQENLTGVTENPKHSFKVRFRKGASTARIWIPIKAESEGAAFQCLETKLNL
jgi:hypothetical protein